MFGEEQTEPVRVAGRDLKCLICQGTQFESRKARVHAGMFRWVGPHVFDEEMTCVVCSQCGYVHWFVG